MLTQPKLFLLLVIGPLSVFGAGINFPTHLSCMSPDLKWRIRCVSDRQENDTYEHQLFLSRFLGSKEELIWRSGRNCDVLWSDYAQNLAITDWVGSNISEVFIVELAQPTKAVSLVVKDVQSILQDKELEGHIYTEALKWESSHRLLICIFGHTDEKQSHAFAYYLSVDTESGSSRLIKKANIEDSHLLE